MTTTKQTLKQVTDDFTLYLKKYRAESTLQEYRRTWMHLEKFMNAYRIKHYDANIGYKFLKSRFGENYCWDKLKTYNQKSFASRIEALAYYQKTGSIQLGARGRVTRNFTGEAGNSMADFIAHRSKAFNLSRQTLVNYKIYLYKFLVYLRSKKIYSIKKIGRDQVLSFAEQTRSKRFAARHMAYQTIKLYIKYLFEQGLISVDFTRTLPDDNFKKQTHLPSTYSENEINTFLLSIDRGSPKGKRDYAIFLLILKLGIRSSDIRNLKFENISWEKSIISFEQEKTKKPLTLPLPAEVGNAIIEYLKYGRPISDEKYCFLGIMGPYKKMGYNDIKNLVLHYLKRAKININNRSHGPHALRHSFATHLLNNKTPLPIISETLGHSVATSTMQYLRVDLNSLRQCALEVPNITSQASKTKGGRYAR